MTFFLDNFNKIFFFISFLKKHFGAKNQSLSYFKTGNVEVFCGTFLANHGLRFKVKFTVEMNKNKWLFLVFGLLFLAIMLWIGYDMSSKTTFPGSKPNLKERIENN
jgi:hypothetical protein